MNLEQLYALIGPDMKAVDAVIRDRLYSDVALVSQVAEYIISSGGKRMRPALVLLAAGAMNYQGTRHQELAAVIEFIHTATLLHDDVVDESALRRGRDTANAMFGNAASVLVGDFLYSRAFQMMVAVDNMRVMQVLSDATNVIAEGEVLQLMNCHDADVDEARYMQVIHYKTAKLFEAAAQLGAILGQASPEVEKALAAYNAGPTRYDAHLANGRALPAETVDYVAKIAPLIGGKVPVMRLAGIGSRASWSRGPIFVGRSLVHPDDASTTSDLPSNRPSNAPAIVDLSALVPPFDGIFVRRPRSDGEQR